MEPAILGFATSTLIALVGGFLFQLGFFWCYRLPIFALIALSILGVLWAVAQFVLGYDFIQNNLMSVLWWAWPDAAGPACLCGYQRPAIGAMEAECSFWLYVLGALATVHSIIAPGQTIR